MLELLSCELCADCQLMNLGSPWEFQCGARCGEVLPATSPFSFAAALALSFAMAFASQGKSMASFYESIQRL